MKLRDLVHPSSIIAELSSDDRNGVIRDLVNVLGEADLLGAEAVDSVVRSIITRERTRGTTGFGKGVAVPHAKVEGLRRVIAAVGRSSAGIDFGSLDGQPVYTVFLIISPMEKPDEHLEAMNLVFQHLQQEQFRRFMRQSDTAEKIYDLLREADEESLVA